MHVIDPGRLAVWGVLNEFFKHLEFKLRNPYVELKENLRTLDELKDLIASAKIAVGSAGVVAGELHENNYLPRLLNEDILVFNGTEFIRNQITGWRYIPPHGDTWCGSVDIFVLNQPVSFRLTMDDVIEMEMHLYPISRLKFPSATINLDHPIEKEMSDSLRRRLNRLIYSDDKLINEVDDDQAHKDIRDGIDKHYLQHHGKSYLNVLKETFDKVLLITNSNN